MTQKRFFNSKFAVSFIGVLVFALALVTVGCSSSEKKDEAEVKEKAVKEEVQEAPSDETVEATPTLRPGPPYELIEACSSLNEGDECSVALTNGQFNGFCKKLRNGEIACMPRPRPGKSSVTSDETPPTEHFKRKGSDEN